MGSQSVLIRRLIVGLSVFFILASLSVGCVNRDSPSAVPPTQPAALSIDSNYPIPKPGSAFSIQFDGEIKLEHLRGHVVDLDLFETEPDMIQALQAQGKLVMCYLSAGSWEEWRPDAAAYPPSLLGKKYAGWPGEKWVDIRQIEQLAPILESRLDLCQEKGFDGVEADNMDHYQNDTGFDIQPAHQLLFNRWVALQAHLRGLSIGLKNDPEQAPDLVEDFDWALVEDCFAEGWCELYHVFTAQNKAVYALEYTDRRHNKEDVCRQAERLGISVVFKNRSLDAYAETCP